MQLPYKIKQDIYNKFLTLKDLGEQPAISAIAKDYGLMSHEVKKYIKQATPKLNKATKNFTGKVTSKDCLDLWYEVIKARAGYRCEKSGDTRVLQSHHIIPSTCWALRFDLENGVCLTRQLHLFWAHRDGTDFYNWIKTKRNMEYLESKRHNRSKHDYNAIYLHLQNELKKYKK